MRRRIVLDLNMHFRVAVIIRLESVVILRVIWFIRWRKILGYGKIILKCV